MHLYLGYLLVHFSFLILKLSESNVPISAMVYSVVVVFIWSFIPFTGYCLAKLLKAKGEATNVVLLTFGVAIGAFERGLFHFNILTTEQSNIGMFIVFILFFIVAYISTNKNKLKESEAYN